MSVALPDYQIRVHADCASSELIEEWDRYRTGLNHIACGQDPRWLLVLKQAFGHDVFCIEAVRGERIVGLLPVALVASQLFGRFLVSLPYLNSAGVLADDERIAAALIDRACELADRFDVRYLEIRHEGELKHERLGHTRTNKVHMRLELPESTEQLWTRFKPKVRNQIRKAEQHALTIHWGGVELLDAFYSVLSHNMRDLGTPVFGRQLFRGVLTQFKDRSELAVVQSKDKPVAAALLVHAPGVTEVPTAGSLRQFNSTNANMLMYWHLLQRAVQREQQVFDFGRSTIDDNTYRFKKQWGARAEPAVWQYYLRRGTIGDMRPDNAKYQWLIRTWRRLPLRMTRLVGPLIVRGIP